MARSKKNSSKREDSLDILRGLAVIFMVLAHTIAFLHTKSNSILNFFQEFGDTVCFTTFLFVSGASCYLAYLDISDKKWKSKKRKLLKRILELLGCYYLVAFISSLQKFRFPISIDWLNHIIKVILFIEVPGYTEFLIPFIAFSFIIFLFRKIIRKIIKDNTLAVLIGICTYFIAFLLYWIEMPEYITYYKSLFVGNKDWYRFPIFQYSIIFIFGFLIGKFLKKTKSNKKRFNLFKQLSLIIFIFIILSIILNPLGSFPYVGMFERWPPNLSFLSLGLLFSFSTLLLTSIKFKSLKLPLLKNVIVKTGRYAFIIYVYHINLLQIYNYISGRKYDNVLIVIASYIINLALSFFLPPVFIKLKTKLINLTRKDKKSKDSILQDKLFLASIALCIISIIGLYYAVKQLTNNKTNQDTPEVTEKQDTEIKGAKTKSDSNTSTPTLYSQLNREWILRSNKEYTEYSNLILTLKISDIDNKNLTPQYKILGTDINGAIPHKSNDIYEIVLNAFDLPLGQQQIQAYLDYTDYTYESNIKSFNVSYPVYVAWTMDWEGSDAKDKELERINQFCQKHHNLPITHFFNPRIYVAPEITKKRQQYLTDWILGRKNSGDEIGIHLHMHYEIVEAAGVEVRTEPKWTNYLNNGHDVPCSNYTQEEFKQILVWAKSELQKQGLGTPISFRAGGWFANIKVLKSLEETGFIIDSSGRDYYIWGNNRLKGYWHLKPTTQPYKPNISNQNSDASPTLSIWEFPNNGADSWFYKSSDLIKRFKDNYNGGTIDSYKVITYLTHPHAFSIDETQLKPTYDFLDQYHVEDDLGPVIYTTLKRSHNDIVNL